MANWCYIFPNPQPLNPHPQTPSIPNPQPKTQILKMCHFTYLATCAIFTCAIITM